MSTFIQLPPLLAPRAKQNQPVNAVQISIRNKYSIYLTIFMIILVVLVIFVVLHGGLLRENRKLVKIKQSFWESKAGGSRNAISRLISALPSSARMQEPSANLVQNPLALYKPNDPFERKFSLNNKTYNDYQWNSLKSKCTKKPLKPLIEKLHWNCSDVSFDVDFLPKRLEGDAARIFEENNTSVLWIKGVHQGAQMCNLLNSLAGYNFERRTRNYPETLAAFPRQLSEVIYALDLEKFSQFARGTLLECSKCNSDSDIVRCRVGLHNGKLYDVSHLVFKVYGIYDISYLFWHRAPRVQTDLYREFNLIRPSPYLIKILDRRLSVIRSRMDPKDLLVAVHRRNMDGICYYLMSRPIMYQCSPASRHITDSKSAAIKLYLDQIRNSSFFSKNGERLQIHQQEALENFEVANPFTMTCNYTFLPHQIKVIQRQWNILKQPNTNFLVGDDGQTPEGRQAMLNSGIAKQYFDLQQMDLPTCYPSKKFHFMLAEMYGMTKANYHMGCPTSSCDAIVAIWRQLDGKSRGSSYPPQCYDGFYTEPDQN